MRPILAPEEVLRLLTCIPERPSNIASMPRHLRLYHLQVLREFHIVSAEEAKLAATLDLMLRDNYRHINPQQPHSWSSLRGEGYGVRPKPPAMSALVTGLPGTGKTTAVRNCLGTYQQVIIHDSFPNASHPLSQIVWMSCDVPPSGRADALAATLMRELDSVCQSSRFDHVLGLKRPKGAMMLEEWKQAASAQFLGLLHLDEVQNLFRLPALAKRKSNKGREEDVELSIVEDECLKFFLNMYNTGRIALAYSGTPDGMHALTKRLAATQRFTTGGAHQFRHFEDSKRSEFRKFLLPQLMRYQFVAKPLELTDEFAELILELSGGIFRIIIALWVAAHRIAFERTKTDELKVGDFKRAADTYLAPLKPAIQAIRSRDPQQMRRFGDMVHQDDAFWISLWQ